MQGKPDAMIGHAVLREVIRANFLAAVTGADHAAALGSDFLLLLFELDFVQARAKHSLRFGAVLDLGLLVLAGNDQPSGNMSEAHGRISGVHALPARPRGTKSIDAHVFGIELDLDFIGFGEHGYRNRRSVDATLLLGFRHSLHAMHAAFILELTINSISAYQRGDVLNPARRRFAHRSHFYF